MCVLLYHAGSSIEECFSIQLQHTKLCRHNIEWSVWMLIIIIRTFRRSGCQYTNWHDLRKTAFKISECDSGWCVTYITSWERSTDWQTYWILCLLWIPVLHNCSSTLTLELTSYTYIVWSSTIYTITAPCMLTAHQHAANNILLIDLRWLMLMIVSLLLVFLLPVSHKVQFGTLPYFLPSSMTFLKYFFQIQPSFSLMTLPST